MVDSCGGLTTIFSHTTTTTCARGRSAHVHIANLIGTHETKYLVHITLHYCAGGTLLRQLKSLGYGSAGLPEKVAMPMLAQVGSALAHLHAHGVSHRDLKPANLVYDTPARQTIRLVDFGFAALHQQREGTSARKLHTICGTPVYMAPELVRGDGASTGVSKGGYHGPPVDVWAFGCLCFETLCNRMAFTADSLAALNVRVMKGNHDQFADEVSPRARKLVGAILCPDEAKRPSALEVTRRLCEVYRLERPCGVDGRVVEPEPTPDSIGSGRD